jgi:hypothetical protein
VIRVSKFTYFCRHLAVGGSRNERKVPEAI